MIAGTMAGCARSLDAFNTVEKDMHPLDRQLGHHCQWVVIANRHTCFGGSPQIGSQRKERTPYCAINFGRLKSKGLQLFVRAQIVRNEC